MITIYPEKSRYTAQHGWLTSNFSFSFAEYFDPNNTQFGPLRVFNDDVVQPQRGFGSHPHKEMEIVSIVLEGHLKHEDSTGETAVTSFGEVQRMSAGTGVIHSEVNPSSEEPVNFLQLWFMPEENGLKPEYETSAFNTEALSEQLVPIVSKKYAKPGEVAAIHQDLTIYMSDIQPAKELSFLQEADRRTYLFIINGEAAVNEYEMKTRDSARITDETDLVISSDEGARIILIDLP
ncbi:pirin family protein [Bacillus marinisedimentorum]|uniref:pirin family protein n=1 Tax=Bacillus marinisedimentorum TaxID=1821260 RepID=UPI00087290F5|nr:pirin family protein [Bacillus marinisedimentorum]